MKSIRSLGLLVIILVMVFLLTTPIEGSAKWWDKFGKPQYGGTITIRGRVMDVQFDPHWFSCGNQFCFETMFQPDWTLSPDIHPFLGEFIEAEYFTGILAESWERSGPFTFSVHLRQGIHWHDKAPVNGRELVADDVVYTYHRVMGSGSGFTQPNPFMVMAVAEIDSVKATDRYTVEFTLKAYSDSAIIQIMYGGDTKGIPIITREWVELGPPPAAGPPSGAGPPKGGPKKGGPPPPTGEGTPMQDWKYSVGTGPWLLKEKPTASGQTYVRNPDYWGYDERHPENKLPYADEIKVVGIDDNMTALAALRTGKIDIIIDQRSNPTLAQAANLAKTNPEIQQGLWPVDGNSIDLRCDMKPFTDIRVRKALQMAIDFESISKYHYLGLVDSKPAGLINPMHKDFITPYDEWPSELQQEYTYNPERAKELLAEAGYPDGFKTNCVATSTDDMALLEIIKSEFLDIGVEMDINAMPDMPTFMNYCRDGKHDQMAYFLTTGMAWSPTECLHFRVRGYERNFTHNDDPVFDEMFNKITHTASTAELKELVKKADMYALEQHWTVNVLPSVMAQFWQPWLKAYDGRRAGGGSPMWARLWIDKD